MTKEIKKLQLLDIQFQKYHKKSLPLCAAENIVSDFVKWPLVAGYQERYIMGSAYDFSMNDNFIISPPIIKLYI